MRMWFCRSGLAPSPSAGTSARVRKGLAALAISPKKNTATVPITARAAAPTRSRPPRRRNTQVVYPARISPQSTMLPSSAAQAPAMVKSSGVPRA